MVQAILLKRKTQTRRIINPQPIIDEDSGFVFDGKYKKQYSIFNWKDRFIDDFCKWMPEDILWVRESFAQSTMTEIFSGRRVNQFVYKAGRTVYSSKSNSVESIVKGTAIAEIATDIDVSEKWKPSIHMPREASRIRLEVLVIPKIERLQDISEAHILAEGVQIPMHNGNPCFKMGEDNSAFHFMPEAWKAGNSATSYQYLFAHWAELWCSINGSESWDANPWVWAIEFKKL